MYKSIITYPYGGGQRVRSTHYAHTKLGAWIKALWAVRYGNKDFFSVKVSAD